MTLYHYRPINSALLEIENRTLHFATRDELNDPVEGYVRVYWQGDEAAWEGLLRNYVCSVSMAMDLYALRGDENMLHHNTLIIDLHQFDNVPFGCMLRKLGDAFLTSDRVRKLTTFCGKNELKVGEKELRLLLRFIHQEALILCIEKDLENGKISEEEASDLLDGFRNVKQPQFPFDLPEHQLLDEKHRILITKISENILEDGISFQYVRQGVKDETFLYGKNSDEKITEARQRRHWMSVVVDFPKVYVAQLKEMIYPESFVVCFSGKNDDSAMWGNYAERHQGVCLIYEMANSQIILNHGKLFDVKPVTYGGDLIERNFFETLGRLNLKQIETWLTGVNDISSAFEAFKDEDAWRERYWSAYEAKNYRKLSEWKHENEYRLSLSNALHDFSNPESRNLTYDPRVLKGVIFGMNTSEYDKKRIVKALLTHANEYENFSFYQAEYDDESQSISIRKKTFWELNKF
ncbi:MAG: DUF2971 domain-containing protein [Christensenellales bacterium]|jgi:hypothetical protein